MGQPDSVSIIEEDSACGIQTEIERPYLSSDNGQGPTFSESETEASLRLPRRSKQNSTTGKGYARVSVEHNYHDYSAGQFPPRKPQRKLGVETPQPSLRFYTQC